MLSVNLSEEWMLDLLKPLPLCLAPLKTVPVGITGALGNKGKLISTA